MKNISTFQAVLIGVFGLAAVIGLFIFSTHSSGGNKSQTMGRVVIWGTLPKAPMRAALADLSQKNKEIQNISYIAKRPADFVNDLTEAIASGKGPDLILTSQGYLNTLSGVLSPIPYTAIPQRNFLNTFANIGAVYLSKNGIYGIPVGIDPLILYYNRTLLSSVSIVAPPATWEALTGFVPRITQTTSSRNVSRALIALGSYNNVHNALGILSNFFLQAGLPIVSRNPRGGYLVSLGAAQTNTINGVPPGESLLRFYTSFADPTEVSYTWNSTLPDSQQMFLSGNEALYLGYASEARFFAKANPNLAFDIAPVPQLQSAATKTVYANVYALSIPHGSHNPRGALLATSILSSAAAEHDIAHATGFAPALRSLLASPPNNPVSAVVYPAAIMAHTWLSPAPATTNQIFSSMIQDVITGRISITQALTNAARAINSSLQ